MVCSLIREQGIHMILLMEYIMHQLICGLSDILSFTGGLYGPMSPQKLNIIHIFCLFWLIGGAYFLGGCLDFFSIKSIFGRCPN